MTSINQTFSKAHYMKRRDLIKKIGLATGAVALSNVVVASATNPEQKKKKGFFKRLFGGK